MLGSNPSSTCEKKNQRTEKTMIGVNAYGSVVAEDCCTIYSGNSNINRCDLRIEKVHLGKKKSTRDNNIQFSQLHATSVGNINQNPLSKTWITTTFYQISQLSQLTQTKLTNINKNSLTIHPKSLSHSQNKQTLNA